MISNLWMFDPGGHPSGGARPVEAVGVAVRRVALEDDPGGVASRRVVPEVVLPGAELRAGAAAHPGAAVESRTIVSPADAAASFASMSAHVAGVGPA